MYKMVSNAFFRFLLSVLHCAIYVFEFSCDIWVYLKSELINLNNGDNYKDVAVRIKSLKKVPTHLTILLGRETPSYRDLANLVVWSIASGISFISFYDDNGTVKKNEAGLQYEVEKIKDASHHVIWHTSSRNGYKNGYTGKVIHAKVLSPSSGRKKIVDMCKDVAMTDKSANVDIDFIDNYLRKQFEFPDPDLGVYCGKTFSLFGYPPWQVRVTEFLNVRSHHNIYISSFVDVLERYSRCEQRLGK